MDTKHYPRIYTLRFACLFGKKGVNYDIFCKESLEQNCDVLGVGNSYHHQQLLQRSFLLTKLKGN